MWLVASAPAPAHRAVAAAPLSVDTLAVQPASIEAPVVGYGTVAPRRQVDIVPEVTGKLTRVHPDLAQGKLIAEGELLFQIEDTMYRAHVRQTEADVHRLESLLRQHAQEAKNVEERLATARRILAIIENDFLTTKRLHEQDDAATPQQVAVDEQRYLQQEDTVAQLENRLAIIPHLQSETEAQLEAAKARLQQAEYELSCTEIFCPFDARVEHASAQASQVVTAHFAIATLTDMSAFEISVGIDPQEVQWLVDAAQPDALQQMDAQVAPNVRVSCSLFGRQLVWNGFVTRFERVDEATRTARLVIEIRREDMGSAPAGGDEHERLTLSIGMFCKVELPARLLHDALLVPRHAVHENQWVYVFEPDSTSADPADGRLARRRVPLLRSIDDDVLVDYDRSARGQICELRPGDAVIVSPLRSPIVGMPVRLRDASHAGLAPATAEGPALEPSVVPGRRLTTAVVAHTGALTGIR